MDSDYALSLLQIEKISLGNFIFYADTNEKASEINKAKQNIYSIDAAIEKLTKQIVKL